MKFYLVRHGESIGNAMRKHQSPDMPLSEIGIYQAKMVAHRFTKIPVDMIISSDYVRTVQTAEIIAGITHKEVVKNTLLREYRRPSEIIGKRADDPRELTIKEAIEAHRNDKNWHYSDEENYFDLFDRGRKCLKMFCSQEADNIVVVSHGYFLMILISIIVFEETLTPDILKKMASRFHTKNTGITMCEYSNAKWQLLTWNDHAHLG